MAASENVKETASIALNWVGFMNLKNIIRPASLLTKLLIQSSSFSTSRTTTFRHYIAGRGPKLPILPLHLAAHHRLIPVPTKKISPNLIRAKVHQI